MTVAVEIKPQIHISEQAIAHFKSLIQKEEVEGMGLRIAVDQGGAPKADVSIAFCPPGEYRANDIAIEYDGFTLYVDKKSVPYLNKAEIDYKKDNLSGQLAITAPFLRGTKPEEGAGLADKVNYILQTEVNPNLASHGGVVTLIEVTPGNAVVLQFGGGCHGCGMVDVTLKQGIEQALMSQLPEISAVIDVTNHSEGENPYYR